MRRHGVKAGAHQPAKRRARTRSAHPGPITASWNPSGGACPGNRVAISRYAVACRRPKFQTKTFTTKGAARSRSGGAKEAAPPPEERRSAGPALASRLKAPVAAPMSAGAASRVRARGRNSAVAAGGVTGARGPGGNAAVNVSRGLCQFGGATAGQVRSPPPKTGLGTPRSRRAAASRWAASGKSAAPRPSAVPAAQVIAAGRGGAFVNGHFVGGARWNAVNGAYRGWGCFRPAWFARYPAPGMPPASRRWPGSRLAGDR